MNYRQSKDLDQSLTEAARQAYAHDPSSWEGFGPYTPDVLNHPNAYSATEIQGITFQDLKRMFPNAQETIDQLAQGGVLNTKTHKYLVQNNGNVYVLDKNKQYYFHPDQTDSIRNIHVNSRGPNLTLVDPRQYSSIADPMPYGQALGKNEMPTLGQQIGQGLTNAWNNVTGWFGKAGEWFGNMGNTVVVQYTDENGYPQVSRMTKEEAEKLGAKAQEMGLMGATTMDGGMVGDPYTATIAAAGALLTYAATHPEVVGDLKGTLKGVFEGASNFNTKAQAWGAAGLATLLGMPWLAKGTKEAAKGINDVNKKLEKDAYPPTKPPSPDKDPKKPGKDPKPPWNPWKKFLVTASTTAGVSAVSKVIYNSIKDSGASKEFEESGSFAAPSDTLVTDLPDEIQQLTLSEMKKGDRGTASADDIMQYTRLAAGPLIDFISHLAGKGIALGGKFGFITNFGGSIGWGVGEGIGAVISNWLIPDGLHNYVSVHDINVGGPKGAYIPLKGKKQGETYLLVPSRGKDAPSDGAHVYTGFFVRINKDSFNGKDPDMQIKKIEKEEPGLGIPVGTWIVTFPKSRDADGNEMIAPIHFSQFNRNNGLEESFNSWAGISVNAFGGKDGTETDSTYVAPKPAPIGSGSKEFVAGVESGGVQQKQQQEQQQESNLDLAKKYMNENNIQGDVNTLSPYRVDFYAEEQRQKEAHK